MEDTEEGAPIVDVALATRRLAAVKLQWDRIKVSTHYCTCSLHLIDTCFQAVDLLVLFRSFAAAGHVVENVTVYPSEYGKQQMENVRLLLAFRLCSVALMCCTCC